MMHSGRSRTQTDRRRQGACATLLIAALLCMMLVAPVGGWSRPSGGPVFAEESPVASPAVLSDDSAVTIEDRTTVAIAFPVGLQVTGELRAPEAIDTLSFLFQAGYADGWNLVDIPASDLTSTNDGVSIETVIDLQALQVPVGAHLRYHWLITSASRPTRAASAIAETDWFDDRQPWKTQGSTDVTLHSYGMEPAFAQSILDSAQGTADTLRVRFDLDTVVPITLWIYPDAEAFQEGLPANFRESVVGGSVVGYPLIVAVIPPGSTTEIGRVIPHEISHQMLYQATQNPFALVPTWFDEGLATHVQVGGTSGYMGMVIAAEKRDALFDLTSLAESFPYTASQASLAYAASWSAIAFIEERWGEDGIIAMIHAFADGMPADAAVLHALGISMETFDRDWKAWIHASGEDIGQRT